MWEIEPYASLVHVSRAPFRSLKRIGIKNLAFNRPSYGYFVVLQILNMGHVINGAWIVMVGDDTGVECPFKWCHFTESQLYSTRTLFILKEPFFLCFSDGSYCIRCDSPSDVIIYRRYGPLSKYFEGLLWNETPITFINQWCFENLTAEHYSVNGIFLFNKGKYSSALEVFTSGLNYCQENSEDWKLLQNHKSHAHFQLEQYENAIKTSEMVLQKFKNDAHSLMNVAKSCYQLRQYEKALEFLLLMIEVGNESAESVKLLSEVESRIAEQADGSLSHEKLCTMIINQPFEYVDCADYNKLVGLAYKYPKNFGVSRVVVALHDIPAGTTLLISKAICVMLFNSEITKRENDKVDLVTKAVHLVYRNPDEYSSVFNRLYEDSFPNLRKIQNFCDPVTKEERICDIEKIRSVVFTRSTNLYDCATGVLYGCALFDMPSYLTKGIYGVRHNAQIYKFNDIVIVRSVCPIKYGEEIIVNDDFNE